MTSPNSSSASAAGNSSSAPSGPVLQFSNGAQALGNPDVYLSKGLTGQITQESDLSNEIVEAFVVALATTMTVAATKSAAQSKA